MRKRKILLQFILLLSFINLLSVPGSFAQNNKIYQLNREGYDVIKNLQNRGYLSELNPSSLPYTYQELENAIVNLNTALLSGIELSWVQFLDKELKLYQDKRISTNPSDDLDFYVGFQSNNSRRDLLIYPEEDNLYFFPRGGIEYSLNLGRYTGQFGLIHNLYYSEQEDGLPSQNRNYVRSENAYIGFNSEYLKVYLGRYDNHWGLYDRNSVILSDNPDSYDHLKIIIGNPKIQIQSVYGELDNVNEGEEFTGKAEGGIRRYIAAHRIDWRPTSKFRITIFESFLVSSENSNIRLRYLNPFTTYYFTRDNYPDNDFTNSMFGGSLLFRLGSMSIFGQALLDDMHIANDEETPTFSVNGTLNYSRFIKDNIDFGLDFDLVSYQSYNTVPVDGRYVFLKRGLAYQFNDFIYVSTYLKIYGLNQLNGVTIEPRISLFLKGEQNINQPYLTRHLDGSLPNFVLSGDRKESYRASMDIKFSRNPYFYLESNLGFNYSNVRSNQDNLLKLDFVGQVKIGYRFNFNGTL